MKHGKLMVVAGMIALLCGQSGSAAVYETQTNKPVKNAIAASLAAGPDYKVNDPVVADGYMYRFRVTSTYGPFQATGIGALQKLEQEQPDRARIVKLRFFAGLTNAEAAAAMGVSDTTADRYWAYARAWLQREMATEGRGRGS